MSKKQWLLVGGNSGMGAAIVDRLLARDDEIWCLSRHIEQFSGAVHKRQWNVLEQDFPVDFLPEKLDGLIYCPGSIRLKPFTQIRLEEFQEDLALNTFGAIKALQACYSPLSKSEHASVLLFSTVAVQTGLKFHASVATAKGALEGLVRSLAAEWAPRIRVNAVAPALIETPLSQPLIRDDKRRQGIEQMNPMKRIGQPDSIASLSEWLLTMPTPFVTGQVFAVDGGMSSVRV